MKVESVQINNMINAYTKQIHNYKSEVVNKLPKDKVTISENAKYLSKISNENTNIDIDKVNKIKNEIKQGTYTIDSRKIAEKIIQSTKGE